MKGNNFQRDKKLASRKRFLECFAQCGTLTEAAEKAKVDRNLHYVWMKDPEYVETFEEARLRANDRLEQEALRRAVKGTEEQVFYQGEVCGKIRKFSDVLLIFLMKGAMPDKYRDQWKGELTGKNGGPLAISVLDTILNDSDDGKEAEDSRDAGRSGKVRSQVAPS